MPTGLTGFNLSLMSVVGCEAVCVDKRVSVEKRGKGEKGGGGDRTVIHIALFFEYRLTLLDGFDHEFCVFTKSVLGQICWA